MILYKYLSPSRLDLLAQRNVRFTQPGDFNDPFEFRPGIPVGASDQEVQKYVGQNFERLSAKCYFHRFLLRMRMSKLTTPFSSRIASKVYSLLMLYSN